MERIWSHFKKLDWTMIAGAVFLGAMGIASIYSSSLFREDFLNFKKQIFFLAAGFVLMMVFSSLDWSGFKDQPYSVLALYFLVVLSLVLLLFFAPWTKGIRGWYKIGSFTIDPVEIMKIVLIILLAKYFSMRHVEMYRTKHILISGFYVGLPFILISLQPDLGSALILIFLWLGILLASGIKVRHFLFLLLGFSLLSVLFWVQFLKPYQKERIINFVVPELEPFGSGWSQSQSEIAIGSGGFWGKGLGQGSQVQLGFLSLPQTDFIFSAIAEEFGFLGMILLFLLFVILFLRIIKVSQQFEKNFSQLFGLGLAVLIVSQAFIHIGMNLGILPVVGIPLPFVSYGGSGLICFFSALGILQSLKIRSEK